MKVQINAATRLKAAGLPGEEILKKSLGEFLNRSTLRNLPIVDSALGGIFLSAKDRATYKNSCYLAYNQGKQPTAKEWAAFKSKLSKIMAVYDYAVVQCDHDAEASKESNPESWDAKTNGNFHEVYTIKVKSATTRSIKMH